MAGSEGGAGEDQVTQVFPGQDAVVVTQVVPQHPATEVASPGPAAQAAMTHPPTQLAASASPADAAPPSPVADVVRYGPGVPVVLPVSQGGRTAEHVWRGRPAPEPPRRSARLRRLGGSALTVALLIASGVVLYLRFYHPPLQVTGAAITQHPAAGCRVDVTGRIASNGAAGTVTYRWLFKPGSQQAATLSQSMTRGQHAVDVTVAVEGSGRGSASQTAILQVLSPDRRTASTRVTLSC